MSCFPWVYYLLRSAYVRRLCVRCYCIRFSFAFKIYFYNFKLRIEMNILSCLNGPGGLRIEISFPGFRIIWSGNLSGDMLEGDTLLGDILTGDRFGGGESKRFGNGWKLVTGTLGRSDSKLLLWTELRTGLEPISWSGFSSFGTIGNGNGVVDFGDPNVGNPNVGDPNAAGSVLIVGISCCELKVKMKQEWWRPI